MRRRGQISTWLQGAGCEVQGARSPPRLLVVVPVRGPTGSVLPPPARPAQRGRGSVSVQPPSRHHPQHTYTSLVLP